MCWIKIENTSIYWNIFVKYLIGWFDFKKSQSHEIENFGARGRIHNNSLRCLQIGPIVKNVTLHLAGKAWQGQTL
jgi:hypothetical protein